MEKPNNKLYFPLFYKYGALFSAMPMEEVGKLICSILTSEGSSPPKQPLDGKMEGIYNLVISDADILFGKNIPSRTAKSEEPQKKRHGDFDAEEAFKRALERTYGKST